jgi:outer membrane protein
MKVLQYLALVFVLALTSVAANAEVKIGLIDMRAALFSSKAAQAYSDKMVADYKQQDLEVRAVSEAAQKLEMRLQNDAAIMSDSERAKLAADLEEKVQEFRYLKTKLDKALAEKRQEFLEQSRPNLDTVIQKLVEKESLDLILPREAALYAAPGMDYTSQIIEMLDALK